MQTRTLAGWFLACIATASMAQTAAPRPPEPIAPRLETYKEVDGQALKAHVFARPAATDAKPRAAIVMFHGGGWNGGSPEWVYASARRFADLGLVAVSIQYRLSDQKNVTPLDAMADARDAIRWVRAQAKSLSIDPNRVAAYGVSAGGQLAAAAGMVMPEEHVKGGVSSVPNALVLYSPAIAVAQSGWLNRLLLGRAKAADISPDRFVRGGQVPAHITQGDEDTVTPFSGARNFCAHMNVAGNSCEIRRYAGLGHLLSRKLDEQEWDYDVDAVARADAWRAEERFLADRGFIEVALPPPIEGPEAVVRAHLVAFNAKDIDAMAKRVAEDYVWYNVSGDQMSIESKGRDALRKGMEGYFKNLPSAKSELHMLSTNGNFVSVRERATWKTKSGEDRSQNAFAIYEVVDGLIKRVWYYPTQK